MAHRFKQAWETFGRVNWGRELSLTALDVLKFVGLFHVASTYGVGFTKCVGPSMIPTFEESGDYLLIDNFTYKVLKKPYKPGDVVICICPYDATKSVCKRITATAGDIVTVRQNDYMQETALVPPGHVWLAGDNPHNSTDSRSYGPVPAGLLRGRVFFKLKNFDVVKSGPPPPPPPPAQNHEP